MLLLAAAVLHSINYACPGCLVVCVCRWAAICECSTLCCRQDLSPPGAMMKDVSFGGQLPKLHLNKLAGAWRQTLITHSLSPGNHPPHTVHCCAGPACMTLHVPLRRPSACGPASSAVCPHGHADSAPVVCVHTLLSVRPGHAGGLPDHCTPTRAAEEEAAQVSGCPCSWNPGICPAACKDTGVEHALLHWQHRCAPNKNALHDAPPRTHSHVPCSVLLVHVHVHVHPCCGIV